MKALGILAIIWMALCTLVLLIFHIKSRKPIKSIVLNSLIGFCSIALINLTQKFTGVHIPLNWYTVGGSAVFGLPWVCGMILTQIFI